jgi:predicted metal-dependent hydrolase
MAATDRKQVFKQRVRHWAGKLDIRIVWLGVRPMRNKWASCSTAGHLNFNDELLALDAEVWDYVIVHELLHFFVPNHGRLWKSLMRAHLGDYERIESRLQSAASGSRGKARQPGP